jgi:hypothetical protein
MTHTPNGEISDASIEYGLPPPGRIKPRRDRKMAKKQVHTMAKAEKVAPGSDWHIPLRTADAELVCGYKRTAECTLFQKSDEHPCSG